MLIKPKDNPFIGILDREWPAKQVNEKLKEYIELIQEVVDYGTHLIPRCFVASKKSKRGLIDVVLLLNLLKQSVGALDAIAILVSQGAVYAAHIHLRSVFEIHLYIQWILKDEKEKERKAKQYYVWGKRYELQWVLKAIEGTEENDKFIKTIDKFPGLKEKIIEVDVSDTEKRLRQLNDFLAKDEYSEINAEFDRLKKRHDVHWYIPFNGPNSIADIAGKLKMKAHYDILYTQLSAIFHAQNLEDQVKIKEEIVTLIPVRHLREFNTLLTYAFSFIFLTYSTILSEYRPGELTNFSKKYVEEWGERFRKLIKIRIEYKKIKEDRI